MILALLLGDLTDRLAGADGPRSKGRQDRPALRRVHISDTGSLPRSAMLVPGGSEPRSRQSMGLLGPARGDRGCQTSHLMIFACLFGGLGKRQPWRLSSQATQTYS